MNMIHSCVDGVKSCPFKANGPATSPLEDKKKIAHVSDNVTTRVNNFC